MRELKFRAFDGKKMRYDVTGFEHGDENEMKGVFLDGDYFNIDQPTKYSEYKSAQVMQFTGLTDCNGVDIYESDIVREKDMGVGLVMFEDGSYYVKYNNHSKHAWVFLKSTEVIGNIHSNPELLETNQ